MAIAAGKGAKAQKIGLKEQARRWSRAYPIARRRRLWWELPPSATQGVSRASLPPVPAPNPSGKERAADAPSSTTPPDSARLLKARHARFKSLQNHGG
jgi:hypothetical protein